MGQILKKVLRLNRKVPPESDKCAPMQIRCIYRQYALDEGNQITAQVIPN